MKPPAIEVNALWKRFHKGGGGSLLLEGLVNTLKTRLRPTEHVPNSFWALQDVNLQAAPGEALGIIGPNGAGKSTLLKVLSRILRPDRGRVTVNGRLGGLIEVGAGFHGDLTGRENIFVNGAILGMTRREIRRKFDAIVEFAGIGEFLDMPVKRYSSGMYVRLGFSVAAHMEPDVLLVDEVLSVGDVTFKARCMEAMRGFLRRGTCVVFVSHNLAAVKRFCDRVVLLDHGRIRHVGTPETAIAHYSTLIEELENTDEAGLHHASIGGRSRASAPARITAVRILDAAGAPARSLISGQPARLEIDYHVEPDCESWEPNFAVSVHLFGAGLFYQFESRRDGLRIGRAPRSGTAILDLPTLSLGEGVYQIGVALADDKGMPEHDWHDRAYRISVTSDGVTDGPVYQPRAWRHVQAGLTERAKPITTDVEERVCASTGA